MSTMSNMSGSHKTLNDGKQIPMIGLGVYQATGGAETRAVEHALSCGYRHVDTAMIYQNEEGVGKALKNSSTPRNDVFLTSKIWNDDIRDGRTTAALDESLKRLDVEHIDLMLLHWPVDGRVAAFEELIKAQQAGKVTSIGVSNFLPAHLDELVEKTKVVPAVNQIEHHPWLTQEAIRDACDRHGVAVEAWSPLMQGKFQNGDVFMRIAEAHDRTAAQVVLRWALQRDVIVIPKSVTPERIEANFAVMDFNLSDADMAAINALENGQRLGPDPADFSF